MRKIISVFLCLTAVFLAACESVTVEETGTFSETEVTTTEAEVTTTEYVPEPVVEPTLYSLSFIAAGDNLIYRGNINDAKKNAEGTDEEYDFKPSYTSIKPIIESHDLAFVNQETLMCGEGYEYSHYPRFNSPQEVGDALVDAGFDIIGLSNNHMLDKGEKGFLATLDYWDSQPVTHIGAYRNKEQFENITVIEKNGISIALLSFTEHTNGLRLRDGSEVYIPYIDKEIVAKKVAETEALADITVVSMHWGNEYTFKVNDLQKELAGIICENGGDVIIGHHPHTIQPLEWIETENNRMLCVYSLGNLMAEMEKDYKILGAMVSFNIEKLGDDGKAVVKDVLFIPTVFHFTNKFRQNHVFLLENYTEEQAKNHGISHYGNSTTLNTLKNYVIKNISAEFLPDFLKTEE